MNKKADTRKRQARPADIKRNLVWIASYPKSGNTWTRIFLANYIVNGEQPVPINQVHRFGMSDAIAKTYQMVDKGRYNPTDRMRHLSIREKVLQGISNNGADLNFVKTHNENGKAFGTQLILPRFTRSAIYIVRNPMDVVISYARHYGLTPSKAVEAISRADNTVSADDKNVEQYLGTWSKHVRSWTQARGFPVHVMRYEDMKTDPQSAFAGLLKFLTIPVDDTRLDKAIRFSSFDELRAQEDSQGFIERSGNMDKFFHSGTSGQWEGVLTDDEVERLHTKHGETMRKFGYL